MGLQYVWEKMQTDKKAIYLHSSQINDYITAFPQRLVVNIAQYIYICCIPCSFGKYHIHPATPCFFFPYWIRSGKFSFLYPCIEKSKTKRYLSWQKKIFIRTFKYKMGIFICTVKLKVLVHLKMYEIQWHLRWKCSRWKCYVSVYVGFIHFLKTYIVFCCTKTKDLEQQDE